MAAAPHPTIDARITSVPASSAFLPVFIVLVQLVTNSAVLWFWYFGRREEGSVLALVLQRSEVHCHDAAFLFVWAGLSFVRGSELAAFSAPADIWLSLANRKNSASACLRCSMILRTTFSRSVRSASTINSERSAPVACCAFSSIRRTSSGGSNVIVLRVRASSVFGVFFIYAYGRL